MKTRILLFVACVSVSVLSCKKESNSIKQDFEDTWDFTGLHSDIQAVTTSTEGSDTGVDSTVSSYDSKNNIGTVKFDGSTGSAVSSGVGYTIAINSTDYSYLDGSLQDTSSYTKNDTLTASNSSRGYKLIGSDSVSFSGSGLISDPENSYILSGAHFTIQNSQMTMTSVIVKDSTGSDGDVSFKIHEIVNVTVYLEKTH